MPPERQIPGYYFDADRNRYFKLAHPSLGAPSGSSSPSVDHVSGDAVRGGSAAHTFSNVQKRKRQRIDADRQASETLALKTSGKRTHCLHGASDFDTLRRQALSQPRSLSGSLWARKFRPIQDSKHCSIPQPFDFTDRGPVDGESDLELLLTYSPFFEKALWAAGHTMCCQDAPNSKDKIRGSMRAKRAGFFGQRITALATDNVDGRWAAWTTSDRKAESYLSLHSLSDTFLQTDSLFPLNIPLDTEPLTLAFAPHCSELSIAGTALETIDPSRIGNQWANQKLMSNARQKVVESFSSDILSIQYITQDVIALAARDGNLLLKDLRDKDSRVDLHFKQDRGLCKIRILGNASQIMAAGLRDMALYDLRLGKKSYVQYSGGGQHEDPRRVQFTLVDDDKTLVAAQPGGAVKLWSIDGTFLGRKQIYDKEIRCLETVPTDFCRVKFGFSDLTTRDWGLEFGTEQEL